ncbi:hypothetical protein AAVH_19514 [Aphelenchoides avenae]|nr:hypothetical protein AAVH_19514 [Aphelenchus avenae]
MEAVADTQAVATAAALVVIMDEMAAAVESTTYHQRHRPTGASLRANGPTECLVRSCVPARNGTENITESRTEVKLEEQYSFDERTKFSIYHTDISIHRTCDHNANHGDHFDHAYYYDHRTRVYRVYYRNFIHDASHGNCFDNTYYVDYRNFIDAINHGDFDHSHYVDH